MTACQGHDDDAGRPRTVAEPAAAPTNPGDAVMSGDLTANVIIQIGPLQSYRDSDDSRPRRPFTGDVQTYAEQLTGYLARNLESFTDPRGGDVFLQCVVKLGDQTGSQEYRSGHYVKKTGVDGPLCSQVTRPVDLGDDPDGDLEGYDGPL